MESSAPPPPTTPRTSRLGELARVFLKLGVIGFGGPAAHIAMMDDEVVERRGWLSRQHFLDLIGATNLIPGPNSTEMTMHVGYERAGWSGLFTAGGLFIFPAALATGILAWLYVDYGTVPAAEPLLAGIKPAVLAVILGALWKLGKKAVKSAALGVLAALVAAAMVLGISELPALLVGGVVGAAALVALRSGDPGQTASEAAEEEAEADPPPDTTEAEGGGPARPAAGLLAVGAATAGASVPLWKLFLFFLKVGAVLYGSGYVLIAFLEGDLVRSYGWLTEQQLLDAIAIGQFTPGPVLTTATFIGYLVAGVPGAVVATLGIFLPSFVFVGILNPIVPRLRQNRWASAFLDAVNAAAVALMAVVTVRLGAAVLVGETVGQSLVAWAIFGIAALLALRFKVNAAWLVLGGAIAGALLL